LIRIGKIELPDFPLILAPMEDVTDSPFRSICREYGADMLITEFISSEGLIREAEKSTRKMLFEPMERPLGIQIFGATVASMVRAAEMAEAAGPDFIDLNFGCPVRKVVMKGGGAALLQDIPKMIAITSEVVRATRLPVTVKTRLGWDDQHREIVEISERLQDQGISAISIHGRTRNQLYGGKADWTLIGKVKENPRMKIPVFGNGDVDSPGKAMEMKERYGIDGVLIGRAAVGNPWIFRNTRLFLQNLEVPPPPGIPERLGILRTHLAKSVAYKGEFYTVLELRKFYSGYFRGIHNFKPYRVKLLTAKSLQEIESILNEIHTNYSSLS
jgi:nifR3 family TIM-barrel protein